MFYRSIAKDQRCLDIPRRDTYRDISVLPSAKMDGVRDGRCPGCATVVRIGVEEAARTTTDDLRKEPYNLE